jgi:NAD-dependent deacetylase
MQNVPTTDNQLIAAIRDACNVFVFTGAGVSKESGLPTFRDDDGLWKKFDPMTLATPEAFNREPVIVWNMYRRRQRQILATQPNPAHITLAKMENYYPEFMLTTQNVDDLHERAGSKKLVKLHGDAMQMRCLDCHAVFDLRGMELPEEFAAETLPKCAKCGGLCRPNIVWFGEFVPQEPMMASVTSSSGCDLMLIVGTSGEVSGGYGFAEYAFSNGATIIEINPAKGALNHYATFWVAEPAGKALPEIWELVTG